MACSDGQYFCNDRQKCMPISKKKYEESTSMKTSMKNVDPKDRKVIRSRQKNLFKKDLTGEHQGINELDTKEYKKLNKASVGMMSSDPKVQDKARERQTEIDYKDLLSQIKRRKVKQGKSMKEAAKDQSSKQLDRGMKTTQKAMGVIDNSPYGELSGDKVDRMNKRLRDRRKDISGEKTSKLTKLLKKEDKAFDNVVSMLRKSHGASGVLTKDSPKSKAQPQPKKKPEKDTRSSAQREVDAQYGRTPWNKKGSLGT